MPRLGFGLGLSRFRSGGGSAPATPILDTITGAAAAYSVRKLRSAYTGDAIRVRRSSDNAEADIGFDSNGDLDTTALLAHCGSNSGFIHTWYDQSGNARDVTQATTANQPRIVNAGIVDTQNFLPSVYFPEATALSHASGPLYAAGAMTALFVTARPLSQATLFSENNTAVSNAIYRFGSAATTGAGAAFFRSNTSSTIFASTTLLNPMFTTTLEQFTFKDTGSTVTAYKGLTAGTPQAYTRSGTLTTNLFTLGADIRSAFIQEDWRLGYISEAIFFASALSDTDRELIAVDQSAAFPI